MYVCVYIYIYTHTCIGFQVVPWWGICLPMQETRVQSLGWEDSLEKEWQPTPIFLPGQFHGERSLVVYSPSGCKSWIWLSKWVCACARVHTHTHTCSSDSLFLWVITKYWVEFPLLYGGPLLATYFIYSSVNMCNIFIMLQTGSGKGDMNQNI